MEKISFSFFSSVVIRELNSQYGKNFTRLPSTLTKKRNVVLQRDERTCMFRANTRSKKDINSDCIHFNKIRGYMRKSY